MAKLLQALRKAADVRSLAALDELSLGRPAANEQVNRIEDGDWLQQGWQMLDKLGEGIDGLSSYRNLDSTEARRDWLRRIAETLTISDEQTDWEDIPAYWTGITRKIVAHWTTLLQQEARQAREWLRLEIEAPDPSLRTGHSQLLLEIRNLSGVDAKGLVLEVTDTSLGLHCATPRQEFHSVLERRRSLTAMLPIECDQAGEYRIEGRGIATDLEGGQASETFALRLLVGRAGRAYRPQEIAPYVTGEWLGDGCTFTGRGTLLRALHTLWRQPGGQAGGAVGGPAAHRHKSATAPCPVSCAG